MAGKKKSTDNVIWIAGRRKTAVARVRLEKGKGEFLINRQFSPQEYFPTALDVERFFEPFFTVGRHPQGFKASVLLEGGGKKAQVDAARLAFSKALVKMEPNLRKILRDKSFLTRDPRAKERKKYGLKKARKAPQYSKR